MTGRIHPITIPASRSRATAIRNATPTPRQEKTVMAGLIAPERAVRLDRSDGDARRLLSTGKQRRTGRLPAKRDASLR